MSWDFWHHSTYQVQRTIRTHFQGVRCDNFGRSCLLGQAEKNTFQVSAHICWGMNLFQIRTGGRDQSKQLVLIIPGGWPNFRQLSSKILRLVWYWVGWFLLMFTIGFLMGGVQGHPQSHVRIVSLRNPKFPSYPSCTFVRKPTTISYYQAKNCLPPKMNVYRFINGSWPMHRTKPFTRITWFWSCNPSTGFQDDPFDPCVNPRREMEKFSLKQPGELQFVSCNLGVTQPQGFHFLFPGIPT